MMVRGVKKLSFCGPVDHVFFKKTSNYAIHEVLLNLISIELSGTDCIDVAIIQGSTSYR